MTLYQLRYFYEVAKTLNFSKAAETLFVSQSNLTKYIANLEKELGFKLFDRNTHHCRLTEEGKDFLAKSQKLFFELNSTIENAKLGAANPYHLITIGIAQAELPSHKLLHLLNEKNRNGDIRYIIKEATYSRLISLLREHELDLVVTTDRNARNDDDFDWLALRPFEILMAIHKDHPKAGQPSLSPADLEDDLFFISIPDGRDAPTNRIEEIYQKTGCRLNLTILDSPAELMLNVQTGAGIALVPDTIDMDRYHDIFFYRYEKHSSLLQSLLWRKDEKRPEVLGLVEEIKNFLPMDTDYKTPVLGLEK